MYRRRLIAAPDAVYEHIWRIIHIEEAMIVLLGAALCSRLHHLWFDDPERFDDLNDLRSKITGLRADDDGLTVAGEPGCWSGSIGAWTDLLNKYGRPDVEPSCDFCKTLGQYLTHEPTTDIAMIAAWQRISPVPDDIYRTRIGRLKAINNLRNKLAHVPISERLLHGVHRGLRQEVLSLLSPDERLQETGDRKDVLTTKWHAPLKGCIYTNRAGLTGSAFCQDGPVATTNNRDVWLEWNDGVAIRWTSTPFVRVDGELKVMLLFRVDGLDDESGERDDKRGEYYRFAAEIEPVQKLIVPLDEVQPWLPVSAPAADETVTDSVAAPEGNGDPTLSLLTTAIDSSRRSAPAPPETLPDRELRRQAEDLYRRRAYVGAIPSFDELQRRGDSGEYNHVTMLHHGESLWKSVGRDVASDETTAALRRAIDLLTEATKHRNVDYSARAFYQRSKAYRRLWLMTEERGWFERAKQDAGEAARLDYRPQYVSWYERLVDEEPTEENTQMLKGGIGR